MSTPANKDTLNSLTQNCKDTMTELEEIFPAMMELRAHLTAMEADAIVKPGSILAFFSKTEDFFVGSHFILHELMSSLRLLLDTTIVYEKGYHIQNINLSLCEAYNYFVGSIDNGVWSLLKSMILALGNPILHSYVAITDSELTKLRTEYCDEQMRNSTAHYDEPIKRYNWVRSIPEEDKYCKAVSQFMLIHLRISQISMIIFAIICQIVSKSTVPSVKQKMPAFDVKAFVEDNIVERFSSDERLVNLSGKSLTKISNNIDSLYYDHLKYEKLKEYTVTQNMQFPSSAEILHQLILLRMMVGFIRCDLTCAMRAYMSSKSGVERSLHLRKIYLTEVSGLTYLYGYNKKKNTKSLWKQLMIIDVDCSENESASLQENFEELTSYLDNVRRNLHTHFREDEKLNILKRYEAYKELDQITEINKALNLLHLCKKIENYTMSTLERIRKKEQQKSKEQRDHFNAMFDNLRTMTMNSNSSEGVKAQTIVMFNEMERKLAGLFDLKKRTDT